MRARWLDDAIAFLFNGHPKPWRPALPNDWANWSELEKQLWEIVAAPRFDREAFDRVLMPYQPRMRAAESGAAHELEFYGGPA
jgi:hypothetical protein